MSSFAFLTFPSLPDDPFARDFMQQFIDNCVRDENARLEQQGIAFIKMGYASDELTIVDHDGEPRCVSPKSMLPSEAR